MCSPETCFFGAMDAFPKMKIKAPHLKPGEEHKVAQCSMESVQLSKRSNCLRVVALGLRNAKNLNLALRTWMTL